MRGMGRCGGREEERDGGRKTLKNGIFGFSQREKRWIVRGKQVGQEMDEEEQSEDVEKDPIRSIIKSHQTTSNQKSKTKKNHASAFVSHSPSQYSRRFTHRQRNDLSPDDGPRPSRQPGLGDEGERPLGPDGGLDGLLESSGGGRSERHFFSQVFVVFAWKKSRSERRWVGRCIGVG